MMKVEGKVETVKHMAVKKQTKMGNKDETAKLMAVKNKTKMGKGEIVEHMVKVWPVKVKSKTENVEHSVVELTELMKIDFMERLVKMKVKSKVEMEELMAVKDKTEKGKGDFVEHMVKA